MCEARAKWTLSGTVSHGWADPESGPSVAHPGGRVAGAVVEIVDGADAGRQATTDDHGRYLLESLEEAQVTVRATAEGFAPVDRTLVLASDTTVALAISRELPARRLPVPVPDTDPEWLEALSSDYPHAHHMGNVRVFSDISSAFSEEHAEHLSRVWDFFDALYAENRGAYVDAYYTSDSTVFKKVVPHCPTTFIAGARNVTSCYLDYPRWFIMPYQIPDLGTQLHEIGHDFAFATWPQAWDTSNWFVEGTAMYFEGGVFTDDGSLRVPTPLPFCTDLFRRFDREDRLMPLGQLLRLGRDAFLEDNWRTYSQSCMLFDYLERHEPGVLYSLIHRINAGQVASNDELIAALLELTGKSVSELEEAYESYSRSCCDGGTTVAPPPDPPRTERDGTNRWMAAYRLCASGSGIPRLKRTSKRRASAGANAPIAAVSGSRSMALICPVTGVPHDGHGRVAGLVERHGSVAARQRDADQGVWSRFTGTAKTKLDRPSSTSGM